MLLQQVITFNRSSWNKQEMDIFLIFLLHPFSYLKHYFMDCLDLGAEGEDDCGVVWMEDVFVGDWLLLFDSQSIWDLTNYKWENFDNWFIKKECLISRFGFKIIKELIFIMISQHQYIQIIICLLCWLAIFTLRTRFHNLCVYLIYIFYKLYKF